MLLRPTSQTNQMWNYANRSNDPNNQVGYASSEIHDSTQRKEIFPPTKTYCSFNKDFARLLIWCNASINCTCESMYLVRCIGGQPIAATLLVASKISLRLLWWPPTEHQCVLIYRCSLLMYAVDCFSVGNKVTTTTTKSGNINSLYLKKTMKRKTRRASLAFLTDCTVWPNVEGIRSNVCQSNR